LSEEQPGDLDQRSYPDFPFVGVGVVVWKDDKFLLIQRGKQPRQGQWSIPGGRQELGETVRETAAREVLEETGLSIEVTDFLDVVDSIQKDEKGEIVFHATLIDYSGEWLSGDAQASSDAQDIAWHGLDDLKDLGLWRETERIIRESAELRKRKHRAK
jgi:ADP-ribose pyrophosphatase YjhB (NUDIX family)